MPASSKLYTNTYGEQLGKMYIYIFTSLYIYIIYCTFNNYQARLSSQQSRGASSRTTAAQEPSADCLMVTLCAVLELPLLIIHIIITMHACERRHVCDYLLVCTLAVYLVSHMINLHHHYTVLLRWCLMQIIRTFGHRATWLIICWRSGRNERTNGIWLRERHKKGKQTNTAFTWSACAMCGEWVPRTARIMRSLKQHASNVYRQHIYLCFFT